MPRLDIPDHSAQTLGYLADIPQQAWDDICAEASSVAEPLALEALVGIFRNALGDEAFRESTTRDLIAALADAVAARLTPGQSEDLTIGTLIYRSLSDTDGDTRERIKTRVDQLVKIPSAAFPIKLLSVIGDQPMIMQRARIITDIRPVFPDTGNTDKVVGEGEDVIVRGAIMHTLRLDVFQNWAPLSLYVSLTSGDLALLHMTVARAMAKEKAIRTRGHIDVLGPDGWEPSDA